MKLILNKVYLTLGECVDCGMDENYLRKAKSTGAKCWDFMDDPEDRRRVLVGFDDMKEVYKEKVVRRFGNPYDHVARTPILGLVNGVTNFEANEFFMRHRYTLAGGKEMSLDVATVNKYTRADKWLRMLTETGNKAVKKDLGISVADFFTHVCKLIELEKGRGKLCTGGSAGLTMTGPVPLDILPGDFPGSYRKLMPRVELYRAEGFAGIIDKRLGNMNASKIGKLADSGISLLADDELSEVPLLPGTPVIKGAVKRGISRVFMEKNVISAPKSVNKGGAFDLELYERQMAMIRAIAGKSQNFDAGQVAEMVNIVFTANGWKTLSRERIGQIMSENTNMLMAGRQGKKAYMTKVAMQMRRTAPDMAMKYWTLDGWTVELLFQERGKKGIEYKRLVVVVVLDAFNKYPIGYAIGDRENAELIREANRNAMLHVHELFGKMYRPWQVQSDNYAIGQLTPFYQAMAHLHTPAAVGNAKAKIIEPYFKYLNKEYCQLQQNWSGHNVTANRDNQVNTEFLNKVKGTFPDRKGVTRMIEGIMERERSRKVEDYVATAALWQGDGSTGLTMTGKDNTPQIMNDMDWLMVFGQVLGDRTNKIAGGCIEKIVEGKKYWYDSFDPAWHALMHLNWTLIGDRNDLSRVLAMSEDGKMKFVLEHKQVVAMDVRSASAEDHEYRARVAEFNDEQMELVTEQSGRDAFVAGQIIAGTPMELTDESELALKTMFIHQGQQKERIQDAKKLDRPAPRQIGNEVDVLQMKREERMSRIVDMNKFLGND